MIYLLSNLDNPPKLAFGGFVVYIPAEEKLDCNYSNKKAQLKQMGFDDVLIYPIGYFYDDSVNCQELFDNVDAICLGGGNTILFNYLLKKRGLYPYIINAVKQNKTIIGVSAGGIVLSPTVELAIDADGNPLGVTNYSAAGIISFVPKPHYNKCKEFEHRYRWFEKYSGLKVVKFTDDEYVECYDTSYYIKRK